MKIRIPKLLLEGQLQEIITLEIFNALLENAETIGPKTAVELIMGSKGGFFTVKYTKKDGTDRVMNARLGVKKHLKGGSLPYDAASKGLIPCYDAQFEDPTKAYRMINVTTMSALKINGKVYVIDNSRND